MLNAAQIDSYRENGYLAVEGVLGDDEVAALRRVTDEFVEQSRGVTDGDPIFDLLFAPF